MSRNKKSIIKIRGLLLLMLLTMILAITATYAWFSTQRDVEITGMRLNVEVAESMQISLDGSKWTQSIQIADMRQFYGSYNGTGDSFTIYQANPITTTDGNQNYVPTEMLPVSSAGEVSAGKLKLYTGEYTGSGINDVALCTEDDLTNTAEIGDREEANESHPYLVFDMYLRNVSAKTGTDKDTLILNKYSNVFINTSTADDDEQEGDGVKDTGLEYSARVGMIVYGNTVSISATDKTETTEVDGEEVTTTTTVAEQVRGIAAKGTETAAIWEPNDKEHTPYVVSNNTMGITSTNQAVTTLALNSNAVGQDLTNLSSGSYLTGVTTMKPNYTTGITTTSGVQTATEITDVNGNEVGLLPNQISKVRVYIWLEGQDPDCVDLASTGDKLSINLKLTKEETEEGTGNSYAGAPTGGNGGQGGAGGNTDTYLTADTITADDYGGYVTNYTPVNGVNDEGIGWRIFHADTETDNIYLIADSYVPLKNESGTKNYIPTGYVNTNGDYGFDLMAFSNYNGTQDISSTIRTNLMSQFAGYENTYESGKATAYLLDTTAWKGFSDSTDGSGCAEYAIGGPTLELFTASYNTIHERDIETRFAGEDYEYWDGQGLGYDMKWPDGEYGHYHVRVLDTTEDLYVITDTYDDTVDGQWLASPSAFLNDPYGEEGYIGQMVSVKSSGDVWFDYLTCGVGLTEEFYGAPEFLGARPVICLKSSVQLEKIEQADGSYTYEIVD